jgi:two-component system, cell cycle sensor histidine kinase and response regulator CckA
MTGKGLRPSWFDAASTDAPQQEGERLVSLLRLAISLISVPILIAYFETTDAALLEPLLLSGVAMAIWAALSAACVIVISRGFYHPWLSFASVVADVVVVTLMQIAIDYVLPLNFINGPITTLYFVMIGLAAIRRSRRLVLLVGIGAAVVHVALSAICFRAYMPEWHQFLNIGGTYVEIGFVDEIAVAACLALVGWIVGHVTRALRLSERHYHDLFEHAPDGVLILSADAVVLAVNHRFHEMVGAAPGAPLAGRRIAELLEVDQRVHGGPYAADDPLGSLTLLRRIGGAAIPVRTVAMPIEYQGVAAFVMSVRDVADEVHLERQLAQSQKMETIGRLAGGLAHDFNNILGGIIGSASLAERIAGRLDPGPVRDKLRQQLEVVQECGENARVVVKRLLTFSRTAVIETQPLDLNSLASDVAAICRNTFGGAVTIEVVGTPRPLVARGDPTSLTQALLNLSINARDAMPRGGRLSIRVREVGAEEMSAKRHPSVDAGEAYCCIEVADTGVGMDDGVLEKIFDPFFTTKPPGEGTGLGLSMVYNIARQHGGFVEVQSTIGEGSCFQMFLTRARTSLLPAEPEEPRMPRGTGRVLVVDDEEMLRATVKGMLVELGYDVVCAPDGTSALAALDAEGDRFDLVLLDIVMPVMDGVRTLELMRLRGIGVPVVISSGFMNGASAASLDRHDVAGYLRKPFTIAALARVVDAALRRAAPV